MLEVACSVSDPSSCVCRFCSCAVAYLQHGSITCPEGAWCSSNVCVPSGRCEMYSSGSGPVKCICMFRKSIIDPSSISEFTPSNAGSVELLILGVV